MTVAQQVRSADGTTITYDRVGDAPALILVAGAWRLPSPRCSSSSSHRGVGVGLKPLPAPGRAG